MAVKIYQLSKDALLQFNEVNVDLYDSNGLTIYHYTCSINSTQFNIPFQIEGVESFVPNINDPEFCVVTRQKASLMATGSNSTIIKNIGKDIGKYKYTDNVPSSLVDLPPGFQELYRSS
jgi:hypothetical protein